VANLLHDAVELDLGNLRALESVGREGVANDVLLRALLELLHEVVVDALLDVDTSSGAAGLAVVEEDTKVDPRDGVVDVSILEDNVGDLPPSSRVTFFKLEEAAALRIVRPTTVEPVKAILSTSM
jgi:hypothetical protein